MGGNLYPPQVHPQVNNNNPNNNANNNSVGGFHRPPYVDPQTQIVHDTAHAEYEGWLTKQSDWLKVCIYQYGTKERSVFGIFRRVNGLFFLI